MRQLRLISLICISIFLSGCFQTKLHAPLGRQIRLLAQDEPVKFRTEYKNWYVLYGFVPIWTTQPEEIIRKQNLVEVRARTQDTVLDAIITTASMFLPIMIFPQHVIVEGNRKSDLTPQAAPGHEGAVPSSAAPKALGATPLCGRPSRARPLAKPKPCSGPKRRPPPTDGEW